MSDLIKIAKQLSRKGYSVIPCSELKLPTIPSWMSYQSRPMTMEECEKHFDGAKNIAMLTGGPMRVVCLDADMKYDLSGDLWDRYKKTVPIKLLKKLLCQSTKNGGFHLVFQAPAGRLKGNEKLASRYTTSYEQHITYVENFNRIETMDKALKIASNDKTRVLFETRSGSAASAGGYFLISPSHGYQTLYGKIQDISEDEYDIIMEMARSFNMVIGADAGLKPAEYTTKWKTNPFDHYCEEVDAVQLLLDNGWTIAESYNGRDVRLKRPGHSHAKHSAVFDTERKILNVFSTSTVFDTARGYNAASIFTLLECDNDLRMAYQKLVALGYGVK